MLFTLEMAKNNKEMQMFYFPSNFTEGSRGTTKTNKKSAAWQW